MNTLKTGFLLVAMTALIVLIGGYFGGKQGVVLAFLIACVMNITSYWFSDKIVLSMYKARQVDYSDAPELYSMVERLTERAGLPMPKLYTIPEAMPNAFATGRNPHHAAVAVTDGLLRILDKNEVEAVIAHELGHVNNRDILIGSIAATLAGAIMMLSYFARVAMILGGGGRSDDRNGGAFGLLFMMILAPIAATLIQMAISRSREYQADAKGAQISGRPLSLASALQKLDSTAKQIPSEVSPQTAHMFIVSPMLGGIGKLFSTHPPIPKRVEKLQEIAFRNGQAY